MKFLKCFIGGRIFKTGIAVFLTALICELLNWPAMFAVITAIVTIEPTAEDSIKKAFIRFPASAIGAAFSVVFTFLYGESPLSYMLVAVCTIIACHQLKLHDGMLVATLTGIAMITTVHDEYLTSFFVRLGTTATGLIVSSLVNIFIIPPKYTETISEGIHSVSKKIGDILSNKETLTGSKKEVEKAFDNVLKEIEKLKQLCQYQEKEWRFHPADHHLDRLYFYDLKKLAILQQITYHIGNFLFLDTSEMKMEDEDKKDFLLIMESLAKILADENYTISDDDHFLFAELKDWLSMQFSNLDNEAESIHDQYVSIEASIVYELLSIFDLTVELNEIQNILETKQVVAKQSSN